MHKIESTYIFRKIKRPIQGERLPLYATFELTYRCNFRCIHCYQTDEQKNIPAKEELTTKQVFSILKELRAMGCFFVSFTGGEIFLRKDLMDILWYAKFKGFHIALLTNASLIDEKTAAELRRLEPDNLNISLNAVDQGVFERISGIKGSHRRVFDAFECLRERRISFVIKYAQMTENIRQLPKVKRYSQDIGASIVGDYRIGPGINGSSLPLRYAVGARQAYRISRSCNYDIFEFEDRFAGRKRDLTRLFNCDVGRSSVVINPRGELNLCLLIDYPRYKVLGGSLREGWQIIHDIVDNAKPDENFKCQGCELLPYCSWCPARGWLEDGRFTSCDPESRLRAFERMGRHKPALAKV